MTVHDRRSYIRSYGPYADAAGSPTPARDSRQSLWLLAALGLGLLGARLLGEHRALEDDARRGPSGCTTRSPTTPSPPKLRAEAAVALVDIGRGGEVDQILSAASADDRAEISKSLEPAYEVAMKDPAPEKALAYRDALFSLRQVAPPDDQKRIDAALLPVLEAQLEAGKVRQGEHSLDKMLTAIGPESAAMLVRVLGAPDQPYVQSAELLAKVGDEAARDNGARRAHRPRPEDQGQGEGPSGPLLQGAGDAGRPDRGEVPGGGGHRQQTGGGAAGHAGARRAARPAVLAFALKIAADPKADKAVRDEMFGVVEAIGGLEAEKGLLAIISSDKEEIVRYRAFESVLAAQKAEGIVPALEAFPASASYKRVDVDDLLVKLIEKIGQPARPALVQGARLARAARAHDGRDVARADRQGGRRAGAREAAGDSSPVKGFPAGDTVGKEAAAAAEIVKKKILMALPGRKSPAAVPVQRHALGHLPPHGGGPGERGRRHHRRRARGLRAALGLPDRHQRAGGGRAR